jgi:hypothetical protein
MILISATVYYYHASFLSLLLGLIILISEGIMGVYAGIYFSGDGIQGMRILYIGMHLHILWDGLRL